MSQWYRNLKLTIILMLKGFIPSISSKSSEVEFEIKAGKVWNFHPVRRVFCATHSL